MRKKGNTTQKIARRRRGGKLVTNIASDLSPTLSILATQPESPTIGNPPVMRLTAKRRHWTVNGAQRPYIARYY